MMKWGQILRLMYDLIHDETNLKLMKQVKFMCELKSMSALACWQAAEFCIVSV